MTIQELFNDAKNNGYLQVSAKEGDFVNMLNQPERLRAFYDYVGERDKDYFSKDYEQFAKNIANGLAEYNRQLEQAQQAAAPAVQAPKVDNNQSFLSNLGNAMLQGGGAMSSGDAAALQITNEADKVRKEEQQARAEREAAKTATIPMSAEDKMREDEIRLLESVPHHRNQTRIDELKAQRPSYLQDAKSLDDIYRNYVEGWMANTPEGQQGKKQLDSDFENVVSTLQQQFRESKTYKDIVAKYKEQLKNTDASDETKVQAIYGDIEKELNDAWQKENGDILKQEYSGMYQQLANQAVKGDKGYIKYQQEKFMEGAVQDAIQSGTDEVSQLYKKYNNQTTVNQNPAGIFGPYAAPNMNGNSDAVTNLFAAGELYRQALIRMKDTKKGEYKFGSFIADFARNALNTLPNLATMGVSDLAASKRQADVLKKIAEANAYDNPESVLDESEMALYNAIAANTAAEIARSENTGWGASAAKLSADMLPFVRDIMVGQGLIGGLTEAGKKGIIRGIARTIGNGKWAKVLANVGVTGTGMAESAAIAGFTPSTYALAFDNTAKIDAQGLSFDDSKIKIGKIDTQSYVEGLAEAYDTQIRELFTETGGNTQLMLRALKDTPFIKAFGRTKLGDFNRIFANSTFGQFLNKAAYHGIVGELSEEWENTFYDACKAAIDGGGWEAFKQTYGDFVSPDTQVPMLISFSLPALLGGAAGMRQMRSLNNKYSKAYSDLKNTLAQCGVNENDIEDVVNEFRGSLYAGAIEDMPQAISSIANAYSNGNEDNFQRLNAALSQYAVADAQLGAMQADQSSERSVVKEQYRQSIKEGRFQGESDDTYDPITNKQNGYIYHARQAGDEQSDLHIIDGNVVTTTGADGKLIIDKVSSDEKLTVVDAEGHVTLVAPDELELIEAPVAAYEAKAAYMERANQINEIKPGDSVVVNGESSIIKGKTDEGIVIDVMGTDGQPVETVIPFDNVLNGMTLIKSENQKPVVLTNGSTIRVQGLDNGNGTYSITTQDGITRVLDNAQMQELGLRIEDQQQESPQAGDNTETTQATSETPSAEAPTVETPTAEVPQEQTTEEPQEQKPSYPVNSVGDPDFARMDVNQSAQVLYDLYQGDKAGAQGYADDMYREAQKLVSQLSKRKSRALSLTQRLQEEGKIKKAMSEANAELDKWQNIKLAIASIKTEAERQAEEAQRQKIMQAREERSKTTEGKVENQSMAERYAAAPKIVGNEGTITLPDGRELKGRYILTTPDAATASHDARNNFAMSSGYPVTEDGQSINDRDYTNDPEEQQKVIGIATNYNGNAIKNMPVVSDEGLVYNGNGRWMAGQLAAANGTDGAYTQSLMNNAGQFGFTAEQVQSIPNARVAFQLDERLPYNTSSLAIFNEQETQTQSNTGKAAAYARKLTPQAISDIIDAISGFGTRDAFFNDSKAPFELINRLITDGIISEREKAEMVDGDKLSALGRERLENIMLGTVFSNETIRLMGDDAGLKNSILRALPQIIDNKSLGEFSLEQDINDAIRLLYEVRNSKMPFRAFVSQTVIAEDGQVRTAADNYSPFQLLLAEEMTDGGVDAFRDVLTSYNTEAKQVQGGQVDIFGGLTSTDELKQLVLNSYGKKESTNEGANTGSETGSAAPSPQQSNGQVKETKGNPLARDIATDISEFFSAYETTQNIQQLFNDIEGYNNNLPTPNTEIANTIQEIKSALDEYGLGDIDERDNAVEELRNRIAHALGFDKLESTEVTLTDGRTVTPETISREDVKLLPGSFIERALFLKKANDAQNKDPHNIGAGFFNDLRAELYSSKINLPIDQLYKEYRELQKEYVDEPNKTDDYKIAANRVLQEFFRVIITVDKTNPEHGVQGAALKDRLADAEKAFANETMQLAQAEAETDTNPTESQKKAGNYKMGHVKLFGFDVTVENPAGSVRRGTDQDGKEWEQTMNNTYGYIRGTEGVDGDHIDVFIGPNLQSDKVFIVDQLDTKTREFDEHKCLLGFDSMEEAQAAYLSNYEEGWTGMGPVSETTLDEFRKWIDSSHRKTKPFNEYKNIVKAAQNAPAQVPQTPLETAKAADAKSESNTYGSKNTLVTNERYEELKSRMRKKLTGQLNMGVDPEILAIGTEMAVYHIEAGAHKFIDFAQRMITDLGDTIRPYLKAFYNGARDLPEMVAHKNKMDLYNVVSDFDVDAITIEQTQTQDEARTANAEKQRGAFEKSIKKSPYAKGISDDMLKRCVDLTVDNYSLIVDVLNGDATIEDLISKLPNGFTTDNIDGYILIVPQPQQQETTKRKKENGLPYQDPEYPFEFFANYIYQYEVAGEDSKGRLYTKDDCINDIRAIVENWGTPFKSLEKAFKEYDDAYDDYVANGKRGTDFEEYEDAVIEAARDEVKEGESIQPLDLSSIAQQQFKEGDKVTYKTKDGSLTQDATIEQVNSDGTYNLSFTNALGIPTQMIGIDGGQISKNLAENGAEILNNEEKSVSLQPVSTIGTITKSKDTRDGSDIWLVNTDSRVSAEEFKDLKKRAKDNNGYWSSFSKNKGFLFKSEEDANNFNNITEDEQTTDETAANTRAIGSEATACESEVETVISRADERGEQVTEETANPLITRIDNAVEKANEQLMLLGYYEMDEGDYSETGVTKSATRKAVKDVTRVAKQLAKDLGIDAKVKATANIAPAGGDVSFRIPLEQSRELYVTIPIRPAYSEGRQSLRPYGDLEIPNGINTFDILNEIMYRVENSAESGMKRYESPNKHIETTTTYEKFLKMVSMECRDYLPKESIVAPNENETTGSYVGRVAKEQEERKQAKAQAKEERKKDKTAIQDSQLMGDLFADVVEDVKQAQQAQVQEQLDEHQEQVMANNHHGLSVGDKVLYTPYGSNKEPELVEIVDFERDGRPVVNSFGTNWISEVVDWDRILLDQTYKPQNNEPSNTRVQTPNGGVRSGNGQEVQQNEPSGVDRDNSESVRDDGAGSGTVAAVNGAEQLPVNRNQHNFHNSRGNSLEPNTPKARFYANIAAIELMRELRDSNKRPTKAQQQVLAQYSGWGGLGTFFNKYDSAEYNTLHELFNEEELHDAELSINTAYYTPTYIIDYLWDIVGNLGFKGGDILEGSAGIGNILAQMPSSIGGSSTIQAVELDQTTGGILKLLYPDAKVDIDGFQDVDIKPRSKDLVITNVPFDSQLKLFDEKNKDISDRFGLIHNFCIAKNVRALREGGIGVFITTSGTLDKQRDLFQWLSEHEDTDVIGAFRLNNVTFDGAPVTSDIIVVRKRINKQRSPQAIDVSSVTTERFVNYDTNPHPYYDGRTEAQKKKDTKRIAITYNKYFVEHPENMGGEMKANYELGYTYRPEGIGLHPVEGKNQDKLLKKWVASFEEQEQADRSATVLSQSEEVKGEKVGALVVNSKGEICQVEVEDEKMVAKPIDTTYTKVAGRSKAEVLKDFHAVRDALDAVLEYQTKNEGDEGLKPLLTKLNAAYDSFHRKYGNFHANTRLSWLRNDIDFSSVAETEVYRTKEDTNGKKTASVSKADVMSKRVLMNKPEVKVDNVRDGIIMSIRENGWVNTGYIAGLLGRSTEDVAREMYDSGLVFRDPVTDAPVVKYEYLSGNILDKLDIARANNDNGQFNDNIRELERVCPATIPSHLISVSFGATWLDPIYYAEYVSEKTGIPAQHIHVVKVGSKWDIDFSQGEGTATNQSNGVHSEKLHVTIPVSKLLQAAINNQSVSVSKTEKVNGETHTEYDKDATQVCSTRIDQYKDEFQQWFRDKMKADPERSAAVEDTYNRSFNQYVPMRVSKEFIPNHFDGATEGITLNDWQSQAAVRATMQPIMLAHEVGSGKTFTMITAAMEMRRLGTAKKPMIVVQNATVKQFVSEAHRLYPRAKVLSITDKDTGVDGRMAFYRKIKYNDWDMIIIPQSVFNKIPESIERKEQYIQEKIDEKKRVIELMKLEKLKASENDAVQQRNLDMKMKGIEKEIEQMQADFEAEREARLLAQIDGAPMTKKQFEKQAKKSAEDRAKMIEKAKRQLSRKTDNIESFDDMDIDALFIDEAHEYKRLGFESMTGWGIKGIDKASSGRAVSLYCKMQTIFDRTGHKNVVFATGTPISNTAAEVWTFMKYLIPKDEMQRKHIYYFDDFVHNFGKIVQRPEFKTDGKFKEVTRFSEYNNVPELVRLWTSCSDTVLSPERLRELQPDTDAGGKNATDIFLPQSRSLRAIMKMVREQLEAFDKMSGKDKKEHSDIPLRMYGIASAAAIDPRLVDDAADEPNSKTNAAVKETLRALEDSKSYNGAVAIFSDKINNKNTGFNLFEDIRQKLIDAGVPANQIVVISSQSKEQKQKIFDKVNAGEIRVILGSTQKLGVGVNIQERLFEEIHLDAPNRPMDYQQRVGRIIRQGNLHKEWGIPVRLIRFGVEDSLDVTAYQRLKTKTSFSDTVMKFANDMNLNSQVIDGQTNRSMEEDDDAGQFDNMIAQISGSEYAMLVSDAERKLRKLQAEKKQFEDNQVWLEKANRMAKIHLSNYSDYKAKLEKGLKALRDYFPDGKVTTIKVAGKTITSDKVAEETYKRLNAQIEVAIQKAMLTSEDRTIASFDFELDGMKGTIAVTARSEKDYRGGYTTSITRRAIHMTIPSIGIDFVPTRKPSVKTSIEHIIDDIVPGTTFEKEIKDEAYAIEKLQSDIASYEQKSKETFTKDDELRKLDQNIKELTAKMKEEMAAKEAKYAEMDAEVEAINVDAEKIDLSEDEDTDDAEMQISNEDYSEYSQLVNDAIDEALDNAGIDVVRVEEPTEDEYDMPTDAEFSIRQEPAPKKTGIGYKVFYRGKDGKLYPPMVANPNGEATPVGVWLNADAAPIAGESKTGRPQVKAGGKGTQGGSGTLAYRPGWHLGEIPYALQFNRKDAQGNKTLFPKDFVWAEVEYAADNDYQEEAMKEGTNAAGKFQHSLAGLKRVPENGFYRYRTNPNPETDPWIITGAMKVNRVLTDAEVDEIVRNAGREPQQRESGAEYMTVWHGSKALFDNFDSSHFLSGEGSMTYGAGHYVSSNRQTGELYADRVSRYSDSRTAYYLSRIEELQEMANNTPNEHLKQGLLNQISALREEMGDAPIRVLYEVSVPEDNGKNYLQWDKKVTVSELKRIASALDEQALKQLRETTRYYQPTEAWEMLRYDIYETRSTTKGGLGYDIYDRIQGLMNGREEKPSILASQVLSKAGFVGIKVPTGYQNGGDGYGTNYVIFNDNDLTITNKVEFWRTPNGIVYGWAKDGKIYLTKDGLNPNTKIHEYTHLWAKAMQQRNPEGWQSVVENFKGTPIWDEVVNDPNYQNLQSDDDICSEALARFSGIRGAERMQEIADEMQYEAKQSGLLKNVAKTAALLQRVKKALSNFWKWVSQDLFGIKQFTSPEEVADRVLYDLVSSTKLGEIKGGKKEKMMQTISETEGVERDKEVADFLNLSKELDGIDVMANSVKSEFATYQDIVNEAFIAEAIRKRQLRDSIKDEAAKDVANIASMKADDAIFQSFNKQYARITEAMKGEQEFTSSLVYEMAGFVRYLNKIGWLDNANRQEMSSIIKTIARSSSDGKAYLMEHADELMSLVTNITARRMRDHFEQRLILEARRAQRKNISNVETQGSLGIRGQRMIKTLAEIASKHTTKAEDLEPLIEKEIKLSFSAKSQNAADEHLGMADGYIFAKHYIETIQALQKQESQIQGSLNDLKLDKTLRPEAKRDLRHTLNISMMNNHIRQMKAYQRMQDEVLTDLAGGRAAAKEWAQADVRHKEELRGMADYDLQNLQGEIHKRQSQFKYARMVADALTSPTRTFESMLRMLGMDSINGEGKLFNHFIRKQIQASENEYIGLQEAYKTLDEKASEIMGKETTWREMAEELSKLPGATVSFFDGEQTPEHVPTMREYELTQGNLAYIYAVHKMEDGRMKLNAMGIEDKDVYNIATSALDPRVKKLTDWLQTDFLRDLRKKYNEVHMRLFGAPMDEIRNYFPLRIAKGSVKQDDSIDEDSVGNINMAGTSTGTIKVRTLNTKPLDLLNADVFSIPIQHVQEMEHWAAFSELTRDANVLFAYPNFQNKVKNMHTFFGNEKDLYTYLRDTFRVAMGTYKPNTDPVSKAMMAAARGVTAAKISGRTWTAIKQLASHPAFWSYMADEGFTKRYLKNSIHPIDTLKWGLENMPLLRKRYNSRDLGDFVLAQRKSNNEFLKTIQQFMSKYGMAANVFVDSITCAAGAKSVYDAHLEMYLKQGLSNEEAHRKALDDAELAYNRSQQSTEGAFISAVQRDRTWQTVAMSTYRNSNMAYTRNMIMAARNLKHMLGETDVLVTDADGTEHTEKRNAKEVLIERAQRLYEEQGVPTEEARRTAEDDYNRAKRKNIADLLINAYLMNLVWRLFGYLPYLLVGDDDDKKKALIINALSGGFYMAPLTGFIGGQILESVFDGHSDLDEFFRPSMAIASDVKEMFRKISGDRQAEVANDALNLIIQMGTGFDPKTLSEVVVAICMNHGDEGMTDALLDVGAILAIPKSQRKQIFLDQLDDEFEIYRTFDTFKNSSEYKRMCQKYVDYQLVESAPLTFWARQEETEDKAIKRFTNQFNNLCKERFELRGKK